jgi:hypothetical protein
MTNYGNAGHRGYKMSKIISIEPKDGMDHAILECGPIQDWQPGHGRTAEEWATYIQEGYRPIVVGKTRLRCDRKHTQQS